MSVCLGLRTAPDCGFVIVPVGEIAFRLRLNVRFPKIAQLKTVGVFRARLTELGFGAAGR